MALSASVVKQHGPPAMHGGLYIFTIDITLDGVYVDGGWASIDAITGMPGFNAISNLIPPAIKGGYQFEFDHVNTKLKALIGNVSETFIQAAIAEYTQYPANTSTEQAAALCKVYDASAAEYQDLSLCSAGAGYTANYQFFPDTPVALVDFVIFGAAVPFPQIAFDMSVTPATYDAASVVGWDYWNGTAWVSLDASIVYDGSGSTGTTGDYAWEQDGTMTFVPPQDWAASTIDGQLAYWIKASIETGKVANMTQEPIATTEHDIFVPDTGIVFTYNGDVTALEIDDPSDVAHTANDIELIFWNYTTGESSGVIVFPQDMIHAVIPLPYPVRVNIGDKCAIVCTVEDGTNEYDGGDFTYHLSNAEALANDKNLSGLVLRCEVNGYC